MDGWKTIVSFWGPAHFQVRTVSFGEGIVFGRARGIPLKKTTFQLDEFGFMVKPKAQLCAESSVSSIQRPRKVRVLLISVS